MSTRRVDGVTIQGPLGDPWRSVLTDDALAFVAALHREFDGRRRELLERRRQRQHEIDGGARPDFLTATREIRDRDWTVARIPADLRDRRVEIIGPVERKMIINALNSGASVFMADFEDAKAPTWANNLDGQLNLADAVRRRIAFTSPEGKQYSLNEQPAVLFVRTRGWHLLEKQLLVDGRPIVRRPVRLRAVPLPQPL